MPLLGGTMCKIKQLKKRVVLFHDTQFNNAQFMDNLSKHAQVK